MERGHGPAIYRRECPEDVPLIPPDSSGNCIQATVDPSVQFPTPLAEDQAGQLPLHATILAFSAYSLSFVALVIEARRAVGLAF